MKLIDKLAGFAGDAELYELDNPIKVIAHELEGKPEVETKYIVVSAAVNWISGCEETLIFPATEDGTILSWVEYGKALRGEWDIKKALEVNSEHFRRNET